MESYYECFNCRCRAVTWDADFSYADLGMDGEGVIHECHCTNCGADIVYYVPSKEENEDE